VAMTEEEVFKSIPGFEGLYSISNHGRVLSHKYNRDKFLKTTGRKSKQITLTLKKKGTAFCKNLSRIVAEVFIPNPNNFNYILHKDGNYHNNKSSNLEWSFSNRKNLSSKYCGVSFNSKLKYWLCQMRIKNKKISLGSYKTEREAAFAWNKYVTDHNISGKILNDIPRWCNE
jgi:hypothetical protein